DRSPPRKEIGIGRVAVGDTIDKKKPVRIGIARKGPPYEQPSSSLQSAPPRRHKAGHEAPNEQRSGIHVPHRCWLGQDNLLFPVRAPTRCGPLHWHSGGEGTAGSLSPPMRRRAVSFRPTARTWPPARANPKTGMLPYKAS